MKKYNIYVDDKMIATFINEEECNNFKENLKIKYVIDITETIKTDYESIIILNTKSDLQELTKTMKDIEKVLNYNNGKIEKVEHLGAKKLAYTIQKQNEGYYILINFYIDGDNEEKREKIAELERVYRIKDNIMKFITIRKDDEI